MKNLSLIVNLVLIGILTFVGIKYATLSKECEEKSGNNTLEVIAQRTSVRSFTDQIVESDKVEAILRAAMCAPSAVNKQPWMFVVIDDRALLDTLANNFSNAKMLAEAPLAIIVCGDQNKAFKMDTGKSFWEHDCSAATQNILLAATSLGLGSVWTGAYPSEEKVAKISSILNLPSNLIPLNIIPIGYPKGEHTPKDKWNPENIHYNKF